jgi:hypothetical protein
VCSLRIDYIVDKMDESVRERPVPIDFTTSCLSAPLPSLTLRFDEITEDYAELIAATLDSQSQNKADFAARL